MGGAMGGAMGGSGGGGYAAPDDRYNMAAGGGGGPMGAGGGGGAMGMGMGMRTGMGMGGSYGGGGMRGAPNTGSYRDGPALPPPSFKPMGGGGGGMGGGAGEEIMCPNEAAGKVIGHGGETINSIQTRTGAHVRIQPSSEVPQGAPRRITVSGAPAGSSSTRPRHSRTNPRAWFGYEPNTPSNSTPVWCFKSTSRHQRLNRDNINSHRACTGAHFKRTS